MYQMMQIHSTTHKLMTENIEKMRALQRLQKEYKSLFPNDPDIFEDKLNDVYKMLASLTRTFVEHNNSMGYDKT